MADPTPAAVIPTPAATPETPAILTAPDLKAAKTKARAARLQASLPVSLQTKADVSSVASAKGEATPSPTQSQEAVVAPGAHIPGAEGSTPSPATSPAAAGETLSFGDDAAAAEPGTGTPEPGTAETAELTAEQLAALGEDVRKKIQERDKENVKLRKRSQEGEAKIKELEEARNAAETARDEALTKLNDSQSRSGLAGNVFANWQDAKGVGQWGRAGMAILDQFQKISIAHASGEDVPDSLLEYKLPNGTMQKLDLAAHEAAQGWVNDATAWFKHDEQVAKAREQAKPVIAKLSGYEGYEKQRAALMADPMLSARMEELVAKAAFYDLLTERKGTVNFPGKAGAAKSAPTATEAAAQARAPKPTPTPPQELATSTPRMAPAGSSGDGQAEIAALMKRAMTSGKREDHLAVVKARKALQMRGG